MGSRTAAGQPRKALERVHEGRERRDLLDDRRGALLDDAGEAVTGIGRGRRAAAHALGRETDRRERILDLVRHAPGGLLPRGGPLGRDEGRRVLERHDRRAAATRRPRGLGEMRLEDAAPDLERLLPRAGAARARARNARRGASGGGREQVVEPLDGARALAAEQAARRVVQERETAVVAERDDARVESLEDRSEAVTLLVEPAVRRLELRVRGDELGAAAPELASSSR